MAPRVQVPADFGKEHIGSPSHSNMILQLKDGEELRTNSMVLSLNSPVIDHLTTNLFQSTLDVDDFESDAVHCFVEALYTGEVEKLSKAVFQDVNKMAYAFNVAWLLARCAKFFKTVILDFNGEDYDELLCACEVARHAHTVLKQRNYVELFVEKIVTTGVGKNVFLIRYMAELPQLSKSQLNMALATAGDEVGIVANILITHIATKLNSKSLDESSKYLLQNMDLMLFRKNNSKRYGELINYLNKISTSFSNVDTAFILKLHLESSKEPPLISDKPAGPSTSSENPMPDSSNSISRSKKDPNKPASKKSLQNQSDSWLSSDSDWEQNYFTNDNGYPRRTVLSSYYPIPRVPREKSSRTRNRRGRGRGRR